MSGPRPSTLALVPARGGSRGIPGKNVKPLGGRPLIAWALSAIAESAVADRIVVSTDSDEIAAAARAAGAEVPFVRPPELATDDAKALDVVAHALDWLTTEERFEPELLLVVQPTEPFVEAAQIRETLALLLETGADSAITTVEVPRTHHPFHVRVAGEDGTLRFEREEEHYAHPTRQADPARYAFANLYWVRRAAFLRERRLEAGRCVGLPVEPRSAIDLNTPLDWALAELVAEGRA